MKHLYTTGGLASNSEQNSISTLKMYCFEELTEEGVINQVDGTFIEAAVH